MSRLCISLLLLAAATLLLATSVAAQTQQKCPHGCAACEPLSADELAALQAKKDAQLAKKEAKKAKWEAKQLGATQKLVTTNGARRLLKWGGKNKANKKEHVPMKCTSCINDNYVLNNGFCVCKPGFGFPPKPVDGSKPTTPPVCQPCTGNTASGPDAPKPTWPAKTDAVKTSKWGGKKGKKGMNTVEPATGGRHLLGMGGHHGHHSVCVACPNDTYANKGHTKCE